MYPKVFLVLNFARLLWLTDSFPDILLSENIGRLSLQQILSFEGEESIEEKRLVAL